MTSLPPGPRGRLTPTLRFAFAPLDALDRWRRRYGDPFTIRAVNGDVVTTGQPELIKAIFRAPPDLFDPFGAGAIVAVAGAQSIFVQQGSAHRRQRRLLMPPFHGERMQAYADVFAETTRRRTGATERETSMLGLAQSISLEVITRAVFGAEEAEVQAFESTVTELVASTHPLLLFVPALQRDLGGWGPYARLRRALERMDRLLQARIDRARAAGGGDDILSMLVSIRDEDGTPLPDGEIKDHLRTLLFAGHETTAIVLAWVIDQLGRHPEALSALRDDPHDHRETGWLPAVINETLRLFPPVSEVLRTLRAPWRLGDWALPAGAVVSPSAHLLHRNPDIYPDPGRFRPARFLGRRPDADRFIPFGGGHRRCIGAAFAQRELAVAVATLVSEFDFALLRPSPPRAVRRNVTLAPSDGVPVRLRPRRPRATIRPTPEKRPIVGL